MSTGPSGPWWYGPPVPAAGRPPTGTPHPAASLWWRIRHSLWLVLPIAGFGCVGAAGFLYIGLRARRPSWWVPGLVYLAVSITCFALIDGPEEDTTLGSWAIGIFLLAWLISIAHAAAINSSWLHWRATQVPWYAQLPPVGPPPTRPDNLSTPSPDGSWTAPVPPAGPVGTPVDVNSASADQLAALPGIDQVRAGAAVAARRARGGFTGVREFAEVIDLAPHEFARIRDMICCLPVGAPAPPHQPPSGTGRLLDV